MCSWAPCRWLQLMTAMFVTISGCEIPMLWSPGQCQPSPSPWSCLVFCVSFSWGLSSSKGLFFFFFWHYRETSSPLGCCLRPTSPINSVSHCHVATGHPVGGGTTTSQEDSLSSLAAHAQRNQTLVCCAWILRRKPAHSVQKHGPPPTLLTLEFFLEHQGFSQYGRNLISHSSNFIFY